MEMSRFHRKSPGHRAGRFRLQGLFYRCFEAEARALFLAQGRPPPWTSRDAAVMRQCSPPCRAEVVLPPLCPRMAAGAVHSRSRRSFANARAVPSSSWQRAIRSRGNESVVLKSKPVSRMKPRRASMLGRARFDFHAFRLKRAPTESKNPS